MLSLDALRSVRSIVTHANCADGVASALLLRDALPEVPIAFIRYETKEHRELAATPGMLFCDFSPPPERAAEFVAAGAIVLDHHRSAKAIVEACGTRGIYADEEADRGVSGAMLAFEHVWRPLRGQVAYAPFVESFARLAGIYDTWQTSSPLWRAARMQVETLHFIDREAWLGMPLEEIAANWAEKFGWVGETLLRAKEQRVQSALKKAARFTTTAGLRVAVIEGTGLASDASEALGNEVDLLVGFGFETTDGEGRMSFSLRSRGSFDCAAFVSGFGGGGHRQAAGMRRALAADDPHPYAMVQRLLG